MNFLRFYLGMNPDLRGRKPASTAWSIVHINMSLNAILKGVSFNQLLFILCTLLNRFKKIPCYYPQNWRGFEGRHERWAICGTAICLKDKCQFTLHSYTYRLALGREPICAVFVYQAADVNDLLGGVISLYRWLIDRGVGSWPQNVQKVSKSNAIPVTGLEGL
jgi:hypothetical protein